MRLLIITCFIQLFLGACEPEEGQLLFLGMQESAHTPKLLSAPANSPIIRERYLSDRTEPRCIFELALALESSNKSKYENFRDTPPLESPMKFETSLKFLNTKNEQINALHNLIDNLKDKIRNSPENACSYYYEIAKIYYKLGSFDKTMKYLLYLYQQEINSQFKPIAKIALNELITKLKQTLEASNDYKKTIEYLELLINQEFDIDTQNQAKERLIMITNELINLMNEKITSYKDGITGINILNKVYSLNSDQEIKLKIQTNIDNLLQTLYGTAQDCYLQKDTTKVDLDHLNIADECLDFLLTQKLNQATIDVIKRESQHLKKIIYARETNEFFLSDALSELADAEIEQLERPEARTTTPHDVNESANLRSTQSPHGSQTDSTIPPVSSFSNLVDSGEENYTQDPVEISKLIRAQELKKRRDAMKSADKEIIEQDAPHPFVVNLDDVQPSALEESQGEDELQELALQARRERQLAKKLATKQRAKITHALKIYDHDLEKAQKKNNKCCVVQ